MLVARVAWPGRPGPFCRPKGVGTIAPRVRKPRFQYLKRDLIKYCNYIYNYIYNYTVSIVTVIDDFNSEIN
jgi:hypothetical protein